MPTPAPEPEQNSCGLVHINARNGSTVEDELALRPGSSAQARKPPTAHPAPRGERRGVLVLTAGPVPTGVIPPARWPRSNLIYRAGVLALFLPRGPNGGTEGLKTMTRTEHNWAARRRGELTRDRGSRRVSSAIDARRRLNARRADGTPTNVDPFGPSGPRYRVPDASARLAGPADATFQMSGVQHAPPQR